MIKFPSNPPIILKYLDINSLDSELKSKIEVERGKY